MLRAASYARISVRTNVCPGGRPTETETTSSRSSVVDVAPLLKDDGIRGHRRNLRPD